MCTYVYAYMPHKHCPQVKPEALGARAYALQSHFENALRMREVLLLSRVLDPTGLCCALHTRHGIYLRTPRGQTVDNNGDATQM